MITLVSQYQRAVHIKDEAAHGMQPLEHGGGSLMKRT